MTESRFLGWVPQLTVQLITAKVPAALYVFTDAIVELRETGTSRLMSTAGRAIRGPGFGAIVNVRARGRKEDRRRDVMRNIAQALDSSDGASDSLTDLARYGVTAGTTIRMDAVVEAKLDRRDRLTILTDQERHTYRNASRSLVENVLTEVLGDRLVIEG